MSHASDVLSQLGVNTTYAELHQIFAQLAANAHDGQVNESLAAKIDELIERLIRERARDENELNEVQARYESFREANRGVIGWVKRHLPFTETRRQEVDHREDIADQSAEVLADNAVIARAQMLKERILPPQRRRLGKRIADWQSQWDRCRSQPSDAARVLVELDSEINTSQTIVGELKADIDAFAGAKFRDQADVQRRDADLAAARHELDVLKEEVRSEMELKSASLKLLAGNLATELEITDPQFKADGEQLVRLDAVLSRVNESRACFAKLVATIGQITEIGKQLQSLPEQQRQARQAIAHIEGERTGALHNVTAKSQILYDRQSRHAQLQSDVERARQMLASLQSSYDAHLAQRAASKTMAQAVEAEPPAAIVQQYESARSLLDQAQTRLREAQSSLDVNRREVSEAEANVKAINDKLAAEQKKLGEMEKREPQLRSELLNHGERGQREFAAAAAALGLYLQMERQSLGLSQYEPYEIGAGAPGFLGSRGLEPAFAQALLQSTHVNTRHAQAVNTLDRLVQWQDSQHRYVEQQRAQFQGRRKSVWKRRCSELLGDRLAEEACQGGIKQNAEG